jgi:hypothetical protein
VTGFFVDGLREFYRVVFSLRYPTLSATAPCIAQSAYCWCSTTDIHVGAPEGEGIGNKVVLLLLKLRFITA